MLSLNHIKSNIRTNIYSIDKLQLSICDLYHGSNDTIKEMIIKDVLKLEVIKEQLKKMELNNFNG